MKRRKITATMLTMLLVLLFLPLNINAKDISYSHINYSKFCNEKYRKEFKDFLNSKYHKTIKLKLTHNYIGKGSRKFNYEWNGVKGTNKYKVQRSGNKNFDGCSTEYVTGTNYGYWLGGGLGFYDKVAHLDWYIRVKPVFGKYEGRWSKTLFVPGDLEK